MTRSPVRVLAALWMTVALACGDDDGSGGNLDAAAAVDGSSAPTMGGSGGGGKAGRGGTAGMDSDAGDAGSAGMGEDGAGGSGGSLDDDDAGVGGMSGSGGSDAGPDAGSDAGPDAGGEPTASELLASVRAASDGTGLALPVRDVYVTYAKPALGSEPAGFFVQADANGPAIFVAIEPSTLSPALQVGDLVDFTVTDLATVAGLRQVTGLSTLSRTSAANSIEPLITDVSTTSDLVSALDDYESRAIRITGTVGAFLGAGTGFVAAPIETVGLISSSLRLRTPTTVRDTYDLVSGCSVSLDYGVMWRFNGEAEPSAYFDTDLAGITCPAPTVASAAPVDATHVRVIFGRRIDPTSVTADRFSFDNGITASAASTDGNTVTLTTNELSSGTTYTVTVSPLVTDVLGEAVGVPNTATFEYVQLATLAINELNPNISNVGDMIELLALSSGSIGGITIVQRGSLEETLVTLPAIDVAMNDLLIVHLNPVGATGAAPASETATKDQYPYATYSANYDTAWDIHGGATGLTFSNRVLEVRTPAQVVQDVAPFVVSSSSSPPAAFPGLLQALQATAMWFPADCAGVPCTYMTTPSAVDVSVDYLGCGTTATGNTVSRKIGGYGSIKTDWNAAAAHSWGLPNP